MKAGNSSGVLHYKGFDVPLDLVALTGSGPELFERIADSQLRELKRHTGISSDQTIVEIGCGVGRCAIPLTEVIKPPGRYIGIDIMEPPIRWAADNISARFPHFSFIHFDVKDKLHNPKGRIATRDIRLPVADGTVDRVVLWSVFTHLFRDEIQHYLGEAYRALKPDGLVWASCFVISDDVLAASRRENPTPWQLRFENPPSNGCYINNLDVPRGAIGYSAAALESIVRKSGLRFVRPFVTGRWSGFHKEPESGQDAMVLARDPTYRKVTLSDRLLTGLHRFRKLVKL